MRRRWILPFALTLAAAALSGPAVAEELAPRLRSHVRALCAPEHRGRGFGSEGNARARAVLEEHMRGVGLTPIGESYAHPFTAEGRRGANLAGWIEGRRPAAEVGVVLLTAHYDGQGDDGDVHPSADDNASGVAMVLEAARRLVDAPLDRPVAVVFFDGEEVGLAGSRAFVADPPLPLAQITSVVNLDTVGRFAEETLTIFGSDSGDRLPQALRGVNYAFGFHLNLAAQGAGASDDAVFREKGIPALQLFGRAHPDYHRPTDTADKLDYATMAKVTEYVAELVGYLSRAETELTFVPAGADAVAPDASRQTAGRRRVSFGSIPDFQYQGEGVRITGVIPGSPAEAAGLAAGDVIVEFGGAPVIDLTGYSEAMKRHGPGDEVVVVVTRGEGTIRVSVTLEARK